MTGLDDVQLHLIDSVDTAYEMMRWLSTVQGPLAVDTETSGLSPDRDIVRLIQIGDDQQGWAMRSDRWGGVFEDVVSRWEGRYVMHNAKYDVGMLDGWGEKLPRERIDDTRLMAHILDPTASTALKNLSVKYVDPRAKGMQRGLDEIMRKGSWNWGNIPVVRDGDLALYWQYGALDPVLTRKLHDVIQPMVYSEAPAAYELENAVSWVVEKMERRGCVIDREYAQQFSERFLEFVKQAEEWCVQNYGVKPGANADVIKVLQSFGYEFSKLTESGALSLDKEVIGGIDHPLAQTVLKRRQIQKLQSTYLRRFLEYSQYDGLLHPNINVIGGSNKTQGESGGEFGVRTARMSMDTPNLQQLPRHGTSEAGNVVRNCITARPDHVLLPCDFDQIEMRILGHLSQDPGLRDAFLQPVDFFVALGRNIYGDPDFVKSDPRRAVVKNSGYAKAYGAGVDKFAWTAKIGLAEAEQFLARFDALYPGVVAFQRKVDEKAMQRLNEEGVAYVRSPLTGRKHVADRKREYALVNYMIQGMAAEVFKTKLLELDAAGLGDYMILPVHDEVIADVPLELEEDAIQTYRSVMNDDTLLSVPLTAGISRGFRWGDKKEIEE